MDEPSSSSSSAAAIADSSATKKITDTAQIGGSVEKTTTTKSKTSVKLLIKASNQQHDDQIIESDLMWTVYRLKKQISHCYPSKPPIADQKLIYSGQLLNDKLQLKDVIRSYKDVYTHNHIFHLVCATKNSPLVNINQRPKNITEVPQNLNSIANDTVLRPRYGVNNMQQHQEQPQQSQQNPNSLNQLHQLYPQYAHMFAGGAGASSTSAAYNRPPFNYQAMATHQATMYLWMQQVYSDYMDQCLRFSNGSGGLENMPTPQNSAFPSLNPYGQHLPFPIPNVTTTTPVVAASAVPAEVPQPAEEPAAVVAPRFPNIVQEEPDNRDWLDRFFSILRLAVFLTILFFHTSPLRCGMVVLIAACIYLYHIGILRFRRERNNNDINRNNNAAEQIRQGVAQIQQAVVDGEQQQQQQQQPVQHDDENNPAAPLIEVPQQPAQAVNENNTNEHNNNPATIVSFVRTFVITFFTSLLPEAPAL